MAERPLMALLLAGGESRRMGSDKAAIEIEGQTMLARTARLAAAVAESVWVSVRDSAASDALRRQWPMIEDAPEGQGPLAGILAALRHRDDADWLVLACDLPRLDSATLEALRDAAANHPNAPAIAMRSERDGTPEPLCAIWRSSMRVRIEAQLADDRRCARRCLLDVETPLVDAVTHGALANMNAPEDLAALLAEDVA
ncbi:MAG: molybdenum cofactor guanylyltransferase [Pseudomonadota bacterium]